MRSAESSGYRYTPSYPLTKESCARNALSSYNDTGTPTRRVLANHWPTYRTLGRVNCGANRARALRSRVASGILPAWAIHNRFASSTWTPAENGVAANARSTCSHADSVSAVTNRW